MEKAVGPWEVTPASERLPVFSADPTVVDPAAQQLVEALIGGRSLNTAQRAQLVLALGRVMIAKGIVSAGELARALSLDAEGGSG